MAQISKLTLVLDFDVLNKRRDLLRKPIPGLKLVLPHIVYQQITGAQQNESFERLFDIAVTTGFIQILPALTQPVENLYPEELSNADAEVIFEAADYRDNHRLPEFVVFVSTDETNRQLANQLGLAVAPSSAINPFIQDLIATNAVYIGPKEESLTIYIASRDDLEQFANKLLAVQHIYEEFCALLNVSATEYPLRIIKAEAGSLHLHFAGATPIITLMATGIVAVAKFLHRNYTKEGKIKEMPKKFDMLKNAAKLTKEMEKYGFDVSAGSAQIGRANALLNNEVAALLSGAKFVEVDGERHPLAADNESKLLENTSTKLLGDGSRSAI